MWDFSGDISFLLLLHFISLFIHNRVKNILLPFLFIIGQRIIQKLQLKCHLKGNITFVCAHTANAA